MKTNQFISTVGFAILAMSPVGLAETVSFSVTQAAGSSYSDFNLGKFDTNLGTLTGVEVSVNFSTIQGQITFTNGDANPASLNSFDSTFSLRQKSTNALGFSSQTVIIEGVATTPDWNGAIVAGGGSQVFAISAGQDFLTNYTQNISASFFGAYGSVGGVGQIVFQAKDVQSVSSTGSILTLDSSAASANTKLSVIYTYNAVPEPSTFALVTLFGAGIHFVRRRQTL